MNKKLIFLGLFIVFPAFFYAQEKIEIENNPDYKFQSEKNKTQNKTIVKKTKPIFQPAWSFGGNVGLSFWNGGANVLIAPRAYYFFTPQIFTGAGLTYMYTKNTDFYNNTYSSNSFGGSIMTGFRPIRFLQLTTEYEGLNTNYNNNYLNGSFWNNALYLGASFVSGRMAFGFQFDVLHSSTSPYNSAWTPIISFFF